MHKLILKRQNFNFSLIKITKKQRTNFRPTIWQRWALAGLRKTNKTNKNKTKGPALKLLHHQGWLVQLLDHHGRHGSHLHQEEHPWRVLWWLQGIDDIFCKSSQDCQEASNLGITKLSRTSAESHVSI